MPTELYNGAKMRDLIPRKERNVMRKLPETMRFRVLEIARAYGVKWEREQGCAPPGWARALHIRQAIERILDPHAGQRRAGQKSARLRRERDPEGFLLHLRNISKIGVAARRFKRKRGKNWDGTPAFDVISRPRVEIVDWRESEFKYKGDIERNLAGI